MPWIKSNNIPIGITHFNGYIGGRHGLASETSPIDMDMRASSRPASKKKSNDTTRYQNVMDWARQGDADFMCLQYPAWQELMSVPGWQQFDAELEANAHSSATPRATPEGAGVRRFGQRDWVKRQEAERSGCTQPDRPYWPHFFRDTPEGPSRERSRRPAGT